MVGCKKCKVAGHGVAGDNVSECTDLKSFAFTRPLGRFLDCVLVGKLEVGFGGCVAWRAELTNRVGVMVKHVHSKGVGHLDTKSCKVLFDERNELADSRADLDQNGVRGDWIRKQIGELERF